MYSVRSTILQLAPDKKRKALAEASILFGVNIHANPRGYVIQERQLFQGLDQLIPMMARGEVRVLYNDKPQTAAELKRAKAAFEGKPVRRPPPAGYVRKAAPAAAPAPTPEAAPEPEPEEPEVEEPEVEEPEEPEEAEEEAEEGVEEVEEPEEPGEPEEEEAPGEPEEPEPENGYTKADLRKMKKADLLALAKDMGLEDKVSKKDKNEKIITVIWKNMK